MENRIQLSLKPTLLGLLLAFVSHASFAQTTDHIVKGTVSDRFYQEPMPGANIVLVGTTVGTVADAEGKFEFPQRLKEGDQLKFTFVGYQPATFVVGKETSEVLTVHIDLDIDVMIETAIATPVYSKKKAWLNFKRWF